MFLGTWSDIYAHIPVHVHTHLDSPRNSHMTQGQRCTVGVPFTPTHHARHPRRTPLRHADSPSPTHKYTYVYTTGSHTDPGRDSGGGSCSDMYTHKQRHTHQRHTLSASAGRLTSAPQSQAWALPTPAPSRQTRRDSADTHPQVHTHPAARAQAWVPTPTPAHVAHVLRNSARSAQTPGRAQHAGSG